MRILKRNCTHLLVFLLLGLTGYLNAQTFITGNVKSSMDNEPLPGVTIVIHGSQNGTITDLNGNYSIKADTSDVLDFSFIGFLTEEIKVGNQKVIDIALVSDIQSLDEVIVMGYSSKKRSEITSAVTTVTSDQLLDVTSNDIGSLLQGKVAGIQVPSLTAKNHNILKYRHISAC